MIAPLTAEDLLELWRRLFPRDYTEPIENEAGGQAFDAIAQQAAQFARAAEAINVTIGAYYLRPHSDETAPPSSGPRRATGSVQIRRTGAATGAVTIAAGTRLQAVQRDARGQTVLGNIYRLTADATIAAGSLGPVAATIEAERPGHHANARAGTVTAFVERAVLDIEGATVEAGNVIRDAGGVGFTGAMIGQFVTFVTGANVGAYPRRILSVSEGATNAVTVDGPTLTTGTAKVHVADFGELGLIVEQPAAIEGGRHDWLGAIGWDRRVGRQPGETEDSYRARIGALDDGVSPAALLRIASRILSPHGLTFRFLETRDLSTLPGVILDEDPYDVGDLCDGGKVGLSFAEQTRFFVFCVEASGAGDFGAAYDTPSPNVNALDVAIFDGYPVDYFAIMSSLYDAIDRSRGAGVSWVMERDFGL